MEEHRNKTSKLLIILAIAGIVSTILGGIPGLIIICTVSAFVFSVYTLVLKIKSVPEKVVAEEVDFADGKKEKKEEPVSDMQFENNTQNFNLNEELPF